MNGRGALVGRWFALAITNLIKLGGLYVAVHTAATESAPNVVLIGEACFMMAGAQVSEDTILKMVGRMFGAHPPEEHHPEHDGQPPR